MSDLHDLRSTLLAVRDDRGVLTPGVVVEEAAAADHPLHSRFEWDDAAAGHSWRLEQARSLIQSVRLIYREAKGNRGPRSVRAFHSVPDADGNRGYVPADEVAADPLMREMVLRDMEREYKQLKDRYGMFREFTEMIRADLEGAAA